ncbi:hypothetical protein NL676_033179 [Syzygium grande]|nr:hypothetical protein NL676_033179 [Syzygium grande]
MQSQAEIEVGNGDLSSRDNSSKRRGPAAGLREVRSTCWLKQASNGGRGRRRASWGGGGLAARRRRVAELV